MIESENSSISSINSLVDKSSNNSFVNKDDTECLNETDATTSSLNSSYLKTRSGRCIKYNTDYMQRYAIKKQKQDLIHQVKKALKKCSSERSKDEIDLLINCEDLVKHVDVCKQNRIISASHQEILIDEPNDLDTKCKELAEAIRVSKQCVFYTGAGISTAASIPDYRGPNGLWTLLERGVKVKLPDFSQVKPTYSHMALNSLMKIGLIKHIVSQNCDGLHLRSGLDRDKLSELHGNCFIEFCNECQHEYLRLFDVTEKSTFRKHVTGRFCDKCKNDDSNGGSLRDSIIHFGEKLRNGSPYNWDTAKELVKNSDLIVCLGSSLKVLKHYQCLWPKKKSIYIVNIQWTPKDKQAKLKIHGYCDQVMTNVFNYLQPYYPSLKVNDYSPKFDPLLKIAVKLNKEELSTTTKSMLSMKIVKSESENGSLQEESSSNSEESIEDNKLDDNPACSSNSWFTRSFKARKCTKLNKQSNSENSIQTP